MPTFQEYFGLRDNRSSFLIDPEKDSDVLFGDDYKEMFDDVYTNLQERSFGALGYKAVLWGEFGLGKTHFLRHLTFAIKNPTTLGLPVIAVAPYYIKLGALPRRAAFAEFAKDLIRAMPTDTLGNTVSQYVQAHGLSHVQSIASSEEIVVAFEVIGTFPGAARQLAVRWLCGEKVPEAQLKNIATNNGTVSGHITRGKDFASIIDILSMMVYTVDHKVLTYLIDEAERLKNIGDPDAIEQWLDCLRGITELQRVGLIFTTGAGTRDDLPSLLLEQEIERRISPTGYTQMDTLAESNIIDFLRDMLAKLVDPGAATAAQGLNLNHDNSKIWPFDQNGFNAFVQYCRSSPLGNRPSELLVHMQAIAGKAYRLQQNIVSDSFVATALRVAQ